MNKGTKTFPVYLSTVITSFYLACRQQSIKSGLLLSIKISLGLNMQIFCSLMTGHCLRAVLIFHKFLWTVMQ